MPPLSKYAPGLALRLRPQLASPRATRLARHLTQHAPHPHTHQAHHAPYQGPSLFKKWGTRLLIALALPVVYVAGAAFPPSIVLMILPRYAPPAPVKDSPSGRAHTDDVERSLQELEVVQNMRYEIKKGADWYETRPYNNYDPQKIHNSLTAGSLRGPGKLAVPPILFAKHDESEAVAIVHLGRALCGHDGIIHGGLLATVLDETLGRNALLNLPSRIGVTANLNLNYRSPCMADQFVIVRTSLKELKGRKAVVEAKMETLHGDRVVDATALFIEPKWAQFLASSGVTEAMGRPIPQPANTPALMDGSETERII
ncbi:hypothetical protein B9479_003280 [Cryptococcus floricola]|uniref:Thioesterase domain-containing protein n=1 Tax=Cryptococcus floricola TaxID=2591691 RepID=A0A5D3AX71_9TREE|nr:hypothetical protein B9479_003280 [Cryptococcus floricola]